MNYIYLDNETFNSINKGYIEDNEFEEEHYNLDKALDWFNKNKQTRNTGRCVEYIRTMLEESGFNFQGYPRSAYQYCTALPRNGFKHIKTIYGKDKQYEWSCTEALPGDIAVMSHGQYSHICMWDGQHWISDFVQQNAWPYANEGKINIFRYE
jgi:hypothetical protein